VRELERSAKNMRAISRHLSLIPQAKTSLLAWGVLALFVFGLLVWGYFQPLVFAFIGASIILGWIGGFYEKKRINRIKTERRDTICDFRRAFDIRRVDPYIIRASYQEIGRYLDSESGFPLRAADDFTRDLKIDGEDLDDIACNVAKRLNYDMDTCQQNPLYGQIKTVRDFVMFFTHKPSTTK